MATPPGSDLHAELVLDARATLGEGPVWDPERRVLWWVDILAGAVHAFDPTSGSDRMFGAGEAVGAVALRASGGLLVSAAGRIAAMDPATGRLETLVGFGPDTTLRRMNDGKCDPTGAFWAGRMALDAAPGLGSLLRLDPDGTLTTVLEGLTIPNGMAWSRDRRRMYFVDSPRRQITQHAFDPVTRAIDEGVPLVGFPDDAGLPDGLTIDEEDCLWVAMWGGWCVQCISPDGRLIERVELPVSEVSSCTFGGDDLRDLYITTAREDLSPAEVALEPVAGGLFRARPGARGVPAHRFAG